MTFCELFFAGPIRGMRNQETRQPKKKSPRRGGACATRATCELRAWRKCKINKNSKESIMRRVQCWNQPIWGIFKHSVMNCSCSELCWSMARHRCLKAAGDVVSRISGIPQQGSAVREWNTAGLWRCTKWSIGVGVAPGSVTMACWRKLGAGRWWSWPDVAAASKSQVLDNPAMPEVS